MTRVAREILFYSDFPFGYHNREAEEKMARFAARGYRVHYVEQLGIRNPRPRHVARVVRRVVGSATSSESDAPYDVVSPKLLPPRRAPLVDGINRRWLARQLLARLDDASETIFWVRYPTPELVPLVEAVGRLVVYEVVDDHERSPGMTPRLTRAFREAERRVLARARVVFAWSEPIGERLATAHDNVVLAPPAVDVDAFAPLASSPPRSARVATYVGALDFRFHADLVAGAAARLPDWTFVVVGPDSGGVSARLDALPNVRVLGRLAPDRVAPVLADASVCLMPYRQNAYADTLFPIKLVEYLAAGRPVVSTPIRASRQFADVVALAGDEASFALAIEEAALADAPDARRRRLERARPFSWDRRIDEMSKTIESAIDGA